MLQLLPTKRQKTGWAMAHPAHPLATALLFKNVPYALAALSPLKEEFACQQNA